MKKDNFQNSIVLTIHNKEKTIFKIISNILKYTSTSTRNLIIILDGCNDNTISLVRNIIENCHDNSWQFTIIETPDIWETKANNVGLKIAKTKYVTLVQDDMLIMHKNWDQILLNVFNENDIFAVSGRNSHNFSLNNDTFVPVEINGREFPFGSVTFLGRLSARFFSLLKPYFIYRFWRPIHLSLIVNRGPLMLRYDLLKEINFLDEDFAPFELDDADMCCRAFKKWGKYSASCPIYYKEINGSKATSLISSNISKSSIEKNAKLLTSRHYDLSEKKLKIHVLSFASASFTRQQKLQYSDFIKIGFDINSIFLANPTDLSNDFFEIIPYASQENKFGYFSFKPYILKKTLKKIPNGDILIYLDVNDRPLPGLKEYAKNALIENTNINILSASTNYTNNKYQSWFHKIRSSIPLKLLSFFNHQPEAGCLILRNCSETRILLDLWFYLTLLNSSALTDKDVNNSRHDQETLFNLAFLNNSIKFESWYMYRFLKKGLRKYVSWEYYR
jgi:glycosyltransferase involved in cell wall biosynthesis